jgi:replication initiation protein RepC
MEHISLTPFGRQPVTSAQLAARRLADTAPALPRIDKWALFNDLRTARHSFGLGDRSLGVLYALLSFLPSKSLEDGASLVVFPSNAALSDRTHGMAESTLRRHLAALVQAGVIWRRDSPNGKRFSRRGGDGPQAFGFDLRPLLLQAEPIARAAAEAIARAETRRRQRESLVLRLRDASKLVDYGRETGLPGDWDGLASRLIPLRALLRRKITDDDLTAALAEAGTILLALGAMHDLPERKVSGTAAHSGRHHQNSETESSDLEAGQEKERRSDAAPDTPPVSRPALPLHLVVRACPEIVPYARGRLANWRDLVAAASALRGMMGISAHAWDAAQAAMGPESAAITVSAILQRFESIANPGGYLRALTTKALAGGFSPGPMIMALLKSPGRSQGPGQRA